MRRHEGTWRGTQTHLAASGEVTGREATEIVCQFPKTGPYAYRQETTLTRADGRAETQALGGVLRDGALWFDTQAFAGSASQQGDLLLFETSAKAEPGLTVREVVMLGESGQARTRTLHWFENGRCVRWTLCEETRA